LTIYENKYRIIVKSKKLGGAEKREWRLEKVLFFSKYYHNQKLRQCRLFSGYEKQKA